MTTYQQNYEETYKRPLKCIYGCPREISHKKIPPQAEILVVEMNNDENRIMGIGKIENKTASEVYRRHPQPPPHTQPPPISQRIVFSRLFSDRNYTRYIYIGNTHYATREELERNHTQDAQYINEQLINILPQTPHHPIESLERLLFKGAGHMKRGSGITRCLFKTKAQEQPQRAQPQPQRAQPQPQRAQQPQPQRAQPQPQRAQQPQPQRAQPRPQQPEREQPLRPQQQEQPPLQQ